VIRRLIAALAAALAALALAPGAAAQQPYTEIAPPLATGAKGRIEVVEFFWYECPHCYDLEPALEQWVARLPKDVEFVRVPATFNERWTVSARVYYALEAMRLLPKLHAALFNAIHQGGLRITDDRQRADWLQRQGVDAAKFQAIFASPAVDARIKRAAELVAAAKIEGVPTLMIEGRYLVSAGGAIKSNDQMLEVADALIKQSRKSPAPAAKKK
jgi:thiol:disulfide interchange protein DsbA